MSSVVKGTPPKKSKAARMTEEELGDDHKPVDSHLKDIKPQSNGHAGADGDNEKGSDDDDDENEVNIFKETIIEGKRKRFTPVVDSVLQSWLSKNFVSKPDSFLKVGDMYETYVEACSNMSSGAAEMHQFYKAMSEMFPTGLALRDDSPYADVIREKKKVVKKARVQADSLQHKMRDIIKEAIVELGNPRKGLRFGMIRNFVAGKYPALHVADLKANSFKRAVIREVFYSHIECVRGIGACGFYRLPRTEEEEKVEVEAEKREAAEKEEKEKEKRRAAAIAAGLDPDEEVKKEESKKADNDGEKVADSGIATESNDTTESAETKKKEKLKKKKKRGDKKKKSHKKDRILHGVPSHIEDTFALGMTYNCEPKEAGVNKIRRYISEFYKVDVMGEKATAFRKCLESGCERGFWSQMSGQSGLNGTFRLTVDEFDPTADKELTGMVMNAIVACTEPKVSSAVLLKKYVVDYHPDFNVAQRPHLYKKALERAVDKGYIVRLTGIGASGSFQLVKSFTPSPIVLQGKDTEEDYLDSESDDDVAAGFKVESFRDAYVPRPSKRHARPKATSIDYLDPSLPNPKAAPSSARTGKKRKAVSQGRKQQAAGRKTYAESSEDEQSSASEEESEDDAPPAKQSKSVAKKKTTTAKKSSGSARKMVQPPAKEANKKVGGAKSGSVTSRRGSAVRSYTEASGSEDDDEKVEYTPRKSTSRGGSAPGSAKSVEKNASVSARTKKPVINHSSRKSMSKKGNVDSEEDDSEREDEEVYKPKKTLSRGGSSAPSIVAAKKKQMNDIKKTDGRNARIRTETNDKTAAGMANKKKTDSRGKGSLRGRVESEEESDEPESEEERPAARKSAGHATGGKQPVLTKAAKKVVKKTKKGRK